MVYISMAYTELELAEDIVNGILLAFIILGDIARSVFLSRSSNQSHRD